MRFALVSGIFALSLTGCSPVAHIDVTVRSPSDVSFKVSTDGDQRACVDYLVIRDTGGEAKWEISRQSGANGCADEIGFPQVPSNFDAAKTSGALAKGRYDVEVRSGVYQGVAKFTIN